MEFSVYMQILNLMQVSFDDLAKLIVCHFQE